MQVLDHVRKTFAEWFVFHAFEDEQYRRQKCFLDYKLFAAEDALDFYSNHAQLHIEEVMEQCAVLFYAMEEWIRARIPQADMQCLFKHLLTAAKLHDIRMAPTPQQMDLLAATDDMYAVTAAGRTDLPALRGLCQKLVDTAERAGRKDDKHIKVISAICEMPVIRREGWKKLSAELIAEHDDVKQFVRKNHAPLGGLYVLDHAQEIRAYYGEELDITLVAVLVCLHSTSSTGCDAIGYDNEKLRADTIANIRTLLNQRGIEMPCSAEWLNTAVTLASLLRLADTRRSGLRLKSIDDAHLFYQASNGRAELYVDRNGTVQRITNRAAHNILLSECITDFGSVHLVHRNHEWEMQHSLQVRDWQQEELRNLLIQYRLGSYINELATAELSPDNGMKHLIELHLGDDDQPDLRREVLCMAKREMPDFEFVIC